MEYYRSRYEKVLNGDNSVKEIFIAVKLIKNGDVWEEGYWLTVVERDAVLTDESALTAIVDKVAVMGETSLDNWKTNPTVEG